MTSALRRLARPFRRGRRQDSRYALGPVQARRDSTLPPNEPLPGENAGEPWDIITPVRPDTAFVRAVRLLNASGDVLAAVVLIGGGMSLIGLASRL
jgi:hypothetical protein